MKHTTQSVPAHKSSGLLFLVMMLIFGLALSMPTLAQDVFINEIHYDNSGTDAGEAIEVAGPAGTNLAGWTLLLYNGSGGAVYNTIGLSGTLPNQQSGCGVLSFTQAGNRPIGSSKPGSCSGRPLSFMSYSVWLSICHACRSGPRPRSFSRQHHRACEVLLQQ